MDFRWLRWVSWNLLDLQFAFVFWLACSGFVDLVPSVFVVLLLCCFSSEYGNLGCRMVSFCRYWFLVGFLCCGVFWVLMGFVNWSCFCLGECLFWMLAVLGFWI